MKNLSVLLTLSVLGGCGPVFKLKKLKKRTCPVEFQSSNDDLMSYVLTGNGGGSFLFQPANPLLSEIKGDYDLKTGDFWWVTSYVEDSFRTADHATGYGALWRDGDLDLEYTLETQFADGVVEISKVRERRLGCEAHKVIADEEGFPLVYILGDHTSSGFTYTREFAVGSLVVTANGTKLADGSWEENLDYDKDGLYIIYKETSDGVGYVEHKFDQNIGGVNLRGIWERFAGGTMQIDVNVNRPGEPEQTWEYQVDGQGAGDGVLAYGQQQCDLVFTAFECNRVNCTDSNNGACTVPMNVPDPR